MIEPNTKCASSKSTERTFSCIEENIKPELAVLNDSRNESTHDVTNVAENIVDPSKSVFPTMHTMEMSMKLTISCDATTQATSSYVSSISSMPSMRPTRDLLQVPTTSLSSNESTCRSEILTFATNYTNSSSPDTRSILDTVNRHGPPSILNRVPQLTIEETFDLARSSLPTMASCPMNQTTRLSRRTWGFRKFLCCFIPISEEIDSLPHSRGAPPTYSSIYTGPSAVSQEELPISQPHIPYDRRGFFSPINQSSFVAPTPPPSYAQAQGIQLGSYSVEQNISATPSNNSWPPRSIAAICPRCVALVVTTTEIRRSTITHLSAFLLCLCGCWPCCMIPYCLDSCKSIDHYCPVCRTYLGTYRPW